MSLCTQSGSERRGRRRRRALALASAVTAAVVTASCSSGALAPAPATDQATDNLEVMTWWTAGSEKAALQVLFDAVRAQHPNVTIIDTAVSGGAGSNSQTALATRLRAGNLPDSWQTFAGAPLKSFANYGWIGDVSSIYTDTGLGSAIPGPILDAMSIDGKQYGVPTGAHRGNVLWFNSAALTKAGVTAPGAGYTFEQFVADLDKVKAAGVVPLCLGGRDRFTSVELFENNLLSVIGAQGWEQVAAGSFSWSGEQARTALDRFGQVLDRADPQASSLTWDEAAAKLGRGECGFASMNDSFEAEAAATGATDGKDFGAVPYPGTEGLFTAVVDAFVINANTPNGQNGMAFLTAAADPRATLAFNAKKGSVPVRTDADVSSLTRYQQGAAAALRSSTVLLSIAHGEVGGTRFQEGVFNGVAAFQRTRDPAAFAAQVQSR